jgi:hypothetical protein
MSRMPQQPSNSPSNSKWIGKFIEEAIAIEAEEAQKAGSVGYMARLLAQASMPHSKTSKLVHSRSNGLLTVKLVADPDFGLPYGHYPRILLSWITTEAVRTQSPALELGNNLSAFMKQLDLIPAGGRWGTITRLRDHLDRLFGCSITSAETTMGTGQCREVAMRPIEARELWWDPCRPEQDSLWKSRILLNASFFKMLIDRPIPLDLRILRALARLRSPMAIDIYCWLTYRVSYIREPMKRPIPWRLIQLQMGAGIQREQNFRIQFLHWLKVVQTLYPHLRVEVVEPKRGRDGGGGGLILKPCRPSVLPLLR